MIIFYNNKTGKIIGVTEGRVHDEEIIKSAKILPSDMSEEDLSKIVVQWKKEGEYITPDHKQKEIFFNIDMGKDSIYNYKIDLQTQFLIKK